MLRSVLIANRGEIACRIIRTARRLGLETIAVYSDADANARHVAEADRAVHIGAAPARESYLSIERLIEAARRSGTASVHPGYGFLSENPAFVEACAEAGLIFIGPPASAMRAMGSKASAKDLMEQAGVPLLPGYHGTEQDRGFLEDAASRIGFPVMIKAVSGGGGRGMRVVHNRADFAAALSSARQEAASAFGDERVLIERYLERPRHIEVQIFADQHGNTVHLFERDCSAQRRHQKIIEEAPAPDLDEHWRRAMGEAAIRAAEAVGYVGAGTVEFVVDRDGFYFLEMNTRLQVEHPVTEMVTGFDLVEWQFRIAAGEPLPVKQDDIELHGHAIEARIYAEDPRRGFAPSVGPLRRFQMVPEIDGVRVDTGVRQGDAITIHYDAMIAKLICHAPDRARAIARLGAALTHSELAGVTSNLDLLARIVASPEFAAGSLDTGFIERHADTLLGPEPEPDVTVLAVAALGVLADEAERAARSARASADPYSPWHAQDGWWLNTSPERVLHFVSEGGEFLVRVRREREMWRLSTEDGSLLGRAWPAGSGRIGIELDGMRETAAFDRDRDTITLQLRGASWRLRLPDPTATADAAAAAGDRLIAPIPGQITEVLVEPGQAVKRGEILAVLEAMKTVFRLGAPADGIVAEVACRTGEQVEEGQLLVAFVEENKSPD
ncbi:MAG: acetyl/propionyl/methylcrotonyl-CoA carboxylase subunit alpha [Acetobacteraceae bacterium]|nr:acetyl/propionyl/methylcrotonyl-CoA carboxylase subunit alpha [Acetobacteraceae bacterium]